MRRGEVKPAWSLVFFTVLTQAAVGLHLMSTWFGGAILECGPPTEVVAVIRPLRPTILVLLAVGAGAAMLHLGRLGAARFAISNLKSSWLSRELVLVFGFGAAVAFQHVVERLGIGPVGFRGSLQWFTAALGLCVVLAITKVYMLRTVPAWSSFATPAAFFGTAFLLGAAFLAALLVHLGGDGYFDPVLKRLRGIVALMAAWQLLLTGFHLNRLLRLGGTANASARMVIGRFRGVLAVRLSALVVGAFVLILATEGAPGAKQGFTVAAIVLLISELLGRYLFYAMHRRVGL